MSSPYAGNPATFPATYPIPDDSDPPTAEAFNPSAEALGDRTAWLKAHITPLEAFATPLANLAALTAIAAPTNGLTRIVKRKGVYVFDTASVEPTFSPWVLAADDATSGKWVRVGDTVRTQSNPVSVNGARFFTGLEITRDKTAHFRADGTCSVDPGTGPETRLVAFVSGGGLVFPETTPLAGVRAFVGAQWSIDHLLCHGATLTLVVASVKPVTGRAALPSQKFSVGVFRSPRAAAPALTSLYSGGDFYDDPSPDVATYEAFHGFGIDCDQNNVIDRINYMYWAQFWNEGDAGSNVKQNNVLCELAVYQDNVTDARFL